MSTQVFFDLETGGLELHHPIIQLAAVGVIDGQVIKEFEAKLIFDVSAADPKALELNGYSEDRWKDAEPPAIVAQRFAQWLHTFKCIEKISAKSGKPYRVAQLAGYNAAVFDAPRLQKLFQDYEVFLPADYKVLDVMQLVMWYFEINPDNRPASVKLSEACAHFGIPLTNAHDALADVVATAELAQTVGQRLVENIMDKFAPIRTPPDFHDEALIAAARRVEAERWAPK